MDVIQAILIAIIEGITEFLPVSSTGHMILATSLMGIHDDAFVKTYEIVIQLGAIMSVVFLYYKRFFVSVDIYLKLCISFLPTAVVGFLAYETIKAVLFNPIVVSTTLIAGGVLLIWLDRWSAQKQSRYVQLEHISYIDAFKIGMIQCISMIPGMSRSAATILGGVASGFNRVQAAEYSFLLAIPTMFAATGLDLLETYETIDSHHVYLLLIGFVVSFLVAWAAVKAFISFLTRYGFRHFGYYRIVIGIIFLLYALSTGMILTP